jgi:hypothetical protein
MIAKRPCSGLRVYDVGDVTVYRHELADMRVFYRSITAPMASWSVHEPVYGHTIPNLLVETSAVGITRLLEAAVGCDLGYSECLSVSENVS